MTATPALRSPHPRRALRLTVAGIAPLAVALLVLPWRDDLPGSAAALVMVAAVVAVAARGDRVGGVLAALSAAVWFDLFLVRPYGSFAIASRDDLETAVLLLVVGVAVTEIAVRGRHHRADADLATHQLDTIARLADLAGGETGERTVVAAARTALRDVLGDVEVRFERSGLGGVPRLHADGRVTGDGLVWPVDQVGLPPMPFEIVAERGGIGYGRFLVRAQQPRTPASRTALQVAKVLADLTATALARESRHHRTS